MERPKMTPENERNDPVYKTKRRVTLESGQEREVDVYGMSLDSRAQSPEQKELLAELRAIAAEIEHDLHDSFPTASAEEYEHVKERVTTDLRLRDRLFSLAYGARAFGRHHKGYHVGGVLVGLRKTANAWENPWVVLFNANTKINKYGWARPDTPDEPCWKKCAEDYLMDDAREQGLQIVMMDVVAEPRLDDRSAERGITQITLTPCAVCRDRLWSCTEVSSEGDPIAKPSTPVFTADSRYFRGYELKDRPVEHFAYEKVLTLDRLHSFHGEDLPEGHQSIELENGYH